MDCDLCGKPDAVVQISVEGAMMNACKSCANVGRPMRRVSTQPVQRKQESPASQPVRIEVLPEVVEDYASIIKVSRERLGLSHAQLASKIGEKESIIHKLETNHMSPPIALAKKLEQALHIHLVDEVPQTAGAPTTSSNSEGLTIGDIIKFKK
ncbi:TIGR00270 family protein [Candidatus Woesearchaeota archaeon]|nr:TIGR00270 family protein [Candidatus Woesearchaeota archaeon]